MLEIASRHERETTTMRWQKLWRKTEYPAMQTHTLTGIETLGEHERRRYPLVFYSTLTSWNNNNNIDVIYLLLLLCNNQYLDLITMAKSETMLDSLHRFMSIPGRAKFVVKKSYDDWTFKQIFADRSRKSQVASLKLDTVKHVELGSDLAVSQFIIGKCFGRIRDGHGKWIKMSKELPTQFDNSFKVTAIKSNSGRLITEAIDNLIGLDHLESLDLSQNPKLDDFACDQLSRQFRKSRTLRNINLSFNPLISAYGLEILFRIPSLKEIVAIETLASEDEDIDLFVLAAEDEKQCKVLVHKDGRQFKNPELEKLRIDDERVYRNVLAIGKT